MVGGECKTREATATIYGEHKAAAACSFFSAARDATALRAPRACSSHSRCAGTSTHTDCRETLRAGRRDGRAGGGRRATSSPKGSAGRGVRRRGCRRQRRDAAVGQVGTEIHAPPARSPDTDALLYHRCSLLARRNVDSPPLARSRGRCLSERGSEQDAASWWLATRNDRQRSRQTEQNRPLPCVCRCTMYVCTGQVYN